ncbi:MAG TPA: hypothetical protein VES88_16315 [Gemmatimonadaceae bacterium]|nr:hypothetical protein [Gemmatimonadaceae bacterium]
MLDGNAILVPDERGLPLRHVYVGDVARLVVQLVGSGEGIGRAYNISYGESMSLAELLPMLARLAERKLIIERVPRADLQRAGLLPHCSPFSGQWMSELDNTRSLAELGGAGIRYSSPEAYLPGIIEDYESRWRSGGIVPSGYDQRQKENDLSIA